MIYEIKVKKNKFGTIISSLTGEPYRFSETANLEAMNAFSAFVTVHTLSPVKTNANGVTYVQQKTGPKLKYALGHHIQQIRGDQLVGFVKPSVRFLDNIEKVFQFADANRMERSYGFFIGPADNPYVVGLTGTIIPHLFHAVPDDLNMDDDWVSWIHRWAPKAMMNHRYFDANELCSIAVPEAEAPVVVGGIALEATPVPLPHITPEEVAQTEKPKKGWFKKK